MSTPESAADPGFTPGLMRGIPDWVLKRATGASRTEGNALRLQFDGHHTFDAWIEAIDGAQRYVHFENYILRDDRVGRVFRDALVRKAKEGMEVRVLYDWMGSWATGRRFWKPFREAGVEVRAFNPPSVRNPFGLLQRDHRKMVCVDGAIAFIGGFCVGQEWAGDGKNPPWRDTGVEIKGPAAAVCAGAFERIWGEIGLPVSKEARSDPKEVQAVGEIPVWIIEGEPWRSRVYRETQLISASARERIWITDPYFVAPFPMAEALTAAARDGVDVRILLPANNNWPWVGSLSRGGYRGLLEARRNLVQSRLQQHEFSQPPWELGDRRRDSGQTAGRPDGGALSGRPGVCGGDRSSSPSRYSGPSCPGGRGGGREAHPDHTGSRPDPSGTHREAEGGEWGYGPMGCPGTCPGRFQPG